MCRKFWGEKSGVSGCSCRLRWREYGRAFSQGEFPQSSCRPGSLVKQIHRMWHPRGTHCSERCRSISSCDPHSKPATWVSLLLHTTGEKTRHREIERLSQGTQQKGSSAGNDGHGPALCSGLRPTTVSLPAFSNQLVRPRGVRQTTPCLCWLSPARRSSEVCEWLPLQVGVLLLTWTPVPAQGLANHPRACFLCWSPLPETEELYKTWLPLKSQHGKST